MSRIILLFLLLAPCAVKAACGNGDDAKCETDPCKNIVSPICEPAKCGACRPKCFDKERKTGVPCYHKTCPWPTPECSTNSCNVVRNKDCVHTCGSCAPICLGKDGKQIPCTYLRFYKEEEEEDRKTLMDKRRKTPVTKQKLRLK